MTDPRMPAEWEPHRRTWMAWPTGEFFGQSDAYAAWAAVANAVAIYEPITVVVNVGESDIAREWLNDAVTVLELPLDDCWMRDMGPTWITRADGSVAGVDWVFNGWGQSAWATWDNDQHIARRILAATGHEVVSSPMINEGGGIHTDGNGTILLTQTVQLGQGRNEDWTPEQVENELTRTIGGRRFVWLSRGLTRDYLDFGTRGHVDIVACFTPHGEVLMHDQRNPTHPDFEVSAEVRAALTAAGLTVIDLPAPVVTDDEEGPVDYSYVNHYVCNGAVIMCTFDDPHDDVAADILARAYPGRDIVRVDARPIFARGGGIHCITQQEPA